MEERVLFLNVIRILKKCDLLDWKHRITKTTLRIKHLSSKLNRNEIYGHPTFVYVFGIHRKQVDVINLQLHHPHFSLSLERIIWRCKNIFGFKEKYFWLMLKGSIYMYSDAI